MCIRICAVHVYNILCARVSPVYILYSKKHDATRVGAKALRIGGATDCREYTGEAGKGLVKRRGRWASDVAEVYQRELVGTQLELSARMGSAFDTSLEEVVPGWVQPA